MQKELKDFFDKNKKAQVAYVACGVPFDSIEKAEKFCAGTSEKVVKIGRDGINWSSRTDAETIAEMFDKEVKENLILIAKLEEKEAEINNLTNLLGGPDEVKKIKAKAKKDTSNNPPAGDTPVIEEPAEGKPADNTGSGQVTEN